MKNDYMKEFDLNIKNQFKGRLKEPLQISYCPDEETNEVICGLLIPKFWEEGER